MAEDLSKAASVQMTFGAAIVQILLLDLVFSLDSIITAVGMTEHVADHGDRRDRRRRGHAGRG